jgi:hypothetical protein
MSIERQQERSKPLAFSNQQEQRQNSNKVGRHKAEEGKMHKKIRYPMDPKIRRFFSDLSS